MKYPKVCDGCKKDVQTFVFDEDGALKDYCGACIWKSLCRGFKLFFLVVLIVMGFALIALIWDFTFDNTGQKVPSTMTGLIKR